MGRLGVGTVTTMTATTTTPPASPLDPRLTLAMGVQAQPGTYALLLGSGVSTGAGIKTGWAIMSDLVRKAAIATGTDPHLADDLDPAAWWDEHRPGEPLNYSTLLAAVGGSTPASRHGVLEAYFTATPADVAAGRKVPSAAHHAIADLIAGGFVRVVVTTNFDNLIEGALRDRGITAQVITRPEQVRAMQPLVHARATIIKLHGDVTEMTKLNTPDELSSYSPEWDELLDRINSEYGLLISGWSGDTDVALVRALQRNPMRRYPLYWDSRSSKGTAAAGVLAIQNGQVVPAADADELFTSLARSVRTLAQMSEPPLSVAMAVAALKQALGDPARLVEVEDLVGGAVRTCVSEVRPRATTPEQGYVALLAENVSSARKAVHLLAAGTWYDRRGEHTDLWREALTGLLSARTSAHIRDGVADFARLVPAALALRAIGVLAIYRGRYDVVLDLLRNVRGVDQGEQIRRGPASELLRDDWVFDHDGLRQIKGLEHAAFPASMYMREVTAEFVQDYLPDDLDYRVASDDYEFFVALEQWIASRDRQGWGPVSGVFAGERLWSMSGLVPARRFLDLVNINANAGTAWAPWQILGDPAGASDLVLEFEKVLQERMLSRGR